MKTYLYFIIFFMLMVGCVSIKTNNPNFLAQKVYEKHLQVVKHFVEEIEKNGKVSVDTKELNKAVIFLEKTTKIEADIIETYDLNFIPSLDNYNDWKEWFLLNKEKHLKRLNMN